MQRQANGEDRPLFLLCVMKNTRRFVVLRRERTKPVKAAGELEIKEWVLKEEVEVALLRADPSTPPHYHSPTSFLTSFIIKR
jgi:hypothetical protein